MTPRDFKTLRRGLAITQAALAGKMGVHPRTVRRWELGERAIPEPAARLLLRLSADPDA